MRVLYLPFWRPTVVSLSAGWQGVRTDAYDRKSREFYVLSSDWRVEEKDLDGFGRTDLGLTCLGVRLGILITHVGRK